MAASPPAPPARSASNRAVIRSLLAAGTAALAVIGVGIAMPEANAAATTLGAAAAQSGRPSAA